MKPTRSLPPLGLIPVTILATALILGLGCATNPATGERQLALMSEGEEIALGRKADGEISSSMGVYDDAELAGYVARVGGVLAGASERPDLPWNFRVLDDPVVNAFALPGGYLYVTRGILAYMGSEAQLAAVLGHEVGHVTARHSVSQLSKAQLLSVGLGVGTIVSPELRRFSDIAQAGLGLLFLKYSRDDERQADNLGLRYVVRAGYDPTQMPGVFALLGRVSAASGGGGVPGWLSTHPAPEARETRILEKVAALESPPADPRLGRAEYMAQIDGMVFGPNPREGFFRDDLFLHPDLEFQLRLPDGWTARNERQRLLAVSSQQDALVQVSLASEATTAAAAAAFFGQQGVRRTRSWTAVVNGLPAQWGTFVVESDTAELRGTVAFVVHGGRVFQLLAYGVADPWGERREVAEASLASFRRLTDRKALAVQPARLEVVRLDRDLTLEEFQRRYPSSVPLETLALVNQVEPGEVLRAGQFAKRVIGGAT